MSSPPPLPQELLDKIIDNLHHDFGSLKQCSLASSLLKLRSHKYLFSAISLSDMYRIQRLRGLVDANSTLLENVRELELANFWAWVEGDTHLPVVLRMATSLHSLSIRSARCSWSSIHRDTRDALIRAFRSPSLVNLSIHRIYSIPIPIFALNINVMYLALKEATFDAFTDDFPTATSADYSRMTVDTLEIYVSTSPLFHTVIDLPNSFIARIRHLIIYKRAMTGSLAPSIMTAARHSLESLRIQQSPRSSLEDWFPYDFTLLPELRHIAFDLELRFGATDDFSVLADTALVLVVDFFTLSPTAARIQNLSIRIIHPWVGILDFRPFLNTLAMDGQWERLDRILDAAKSSVSSSQKHTITLDLGLTRLDSRRYLYGPSDDFLWRQSVDQMKTFWRDKIHDMMPMASHRGVLVAGDIVYTEI
ncbi:hypothetical protein Hypma_004236 [Hypsizygus marmoreus]|uniref:F-box domain-containing protein n=1 Tax=Hypsizygus marmoreus TaxID=39966 RepID=A0A369J7I8_HYPMA|nr:hypothetical protein Hypma_004236 [Hypsizygus marmoreus]